MATGASYIPISSSYHGLGVMISGKLGGISTILDVHKKGKYASSSSWRLRVRTNANAPAKWMMHNKNISQYPTLDDNGLGCLVDDDSLFDLTFTIRSYEIGEHGKASIETMMNYFQEALANIAKVIGEASVGSNSSYKSLTWVVTRIQVEVDRYPTWGDDVRVIKPYLSIHGKHSLCWDMLICDCKTSEVLVRATSNMVAMNRSTKRLSEIPDEIWAKLNQVFVEKPRIIVKDTRILSNLDETTADHVCSGIMSRWSDLDHQEHVNNVKYISWILESVPESYVKNYELASMTLAYHKECGKHCILQSLTSVLTSDNDGSNHVDCHHMLRLEDGGGLVMKGWTRWRPKLRNC